MATSKKPAAKKPAAKKPAAKKPEAKKPAAKAKPASKAEAGQQDGTTKKTVYQELQEAAKIADANFAAEPKKKEAAVDYYSRLCEAVGELDDSAFDALSTAAQEWFNATGEALNDDKLDDVAVLPGSPWDNSASQADGGKKEPAAASGKKKPAGKKKDDDADDDAGGRKNNSMAQRVRIEVCKDLDIDDADLIKAVKAAGFSKFNEERAVTVAKRTRAVLLVKNQVDVGELK